MNLNVTFVDSDVILAVEVPDDMTVQDLRAYAQEEAGFKATSGLALFHNGRLLNDSTQLREAGLKNDDMVQIRSTNAVYSATESAGRNGTAPSFTDNNTSSGRGHDAALRLQIEAARQQILYDPQLFAQLSQQSPELADALHDPEQFQVAYRKLQQQQMKVKTENEEIDRNFRLALEEMPEAFSTVTMLFANIEVNGIPVKAFIDSGAQTTIMSPDCAKRCKLSHLIDKRHRGMAYGVGQATILGRIHMAPIKIGTSYFACSMTVIEGTNMEFLLGLDMLKHHQATIDLKGNKLIMGNEELPFLSESEIPKNLIGAPGSAGPALVSKPGTGLPRGAMNNLNGVVGGAKTAGPQGLTGQAASSSSASPAAGDNGTRTPSEGLSNGLGGGFGTGLGSRLGVGLGAGLGNDISNGSNNAGPLRDSQGNDSSNPMNAGPPPGPPTGSMQAPKADETIVSNLIGLGFSRPEVVRALSQAGGNADVAAAILFGE